MFLKSHSHLEEKGVNWYVFLPSENFPYSSEGDGERICMGRGERTKKKRMKWKKETGQVNRLECVQVEMERTKTDGEKSQEYRCGKKSHLSLS